MAPLDAKSLQMLPWSPLHVLAGACRTGGLSFFFILLRGAQILTRECIVRGEPVLRLISVNGTFRCVHLSIDHYYRLSRKETRRTKKLLLVCETKARGEFIYAFFFVCASYFSILIFIPLYLMSSSPNDI